MASRYGWERRELLMAGALLGVAGTVRAQVPVAEGPSVAAVRAELTMLLERQAAQWSAGDLLSFCAHYADDAVFVSPSGRTDGRAAVLARYQKKYVDKRGMGALSLDVIHMAVSGALASVVMTWRLVFEGGAKPPAQGFSVIALEKGKTGWKIVHDASM